MKLLVELIRHALALILMMLILAWPAAASDRLASMLNEDLAYDVSFLWFDRLAKARIRLLPGPEAGTYVASLEVRTLGLSAFLTRHRRARYETSMELANGRFRPLRYESVGSRGTGEETRHRRKIYDFDYQRREIRFRKVKTGFPDRQEVRPMPDQAPNDILTAFYNLRAGFVGPIVPGAEYTIPTMVSDSGESILLRVLNAEERNRHDEFPEGGQLCRVSVGRDVFGSEDGAVLVWFNDAGQPGRTVVEDVLGLGDVTGTLRGVGGMPAPDTDISIGDSTGRTWGDQ